MTNEFYSSVIELIHWSNIYCPPVNQNSVLDSINRAPKKTSGCPGQVDFPAMQATSQYVQQARAQPSRQVKILARVKFLRAACQKESVFFKPCQIALQLASMELRIASIMLKLAISSWIFSDL